MEKLIKFDEIYDNNDNKIFYNNCVDIEEKQNINESKFDTLFDEILKNIEK